MDFFEAKKHVLKLNKKLRNQITWKYYQNISLQLEFFIGQNLWNLQQLYTFEDFFGYFILHSSISILIKFWKSYFHVCDLYFIFTLFQNVYLEHNGYTSNRIN